MWNLLSGVIVDQIYGHLDHHKLLPEEQQGCWKRSKVIEKSSLGRRI